MNKCIFLSNFHPFVTRNILDSRVLEELSRANRVVILVPEHKVQYFTETYASNHNVVIEGVPFDTIPLEFANKYFERFADLLLDTVVKKYHKVTRREKFKQPIRYLIETAVTKTLGHSTLFKKFFRYIDFYCVQTKEFDNLFEKYKPDIVFSTDIFDASNVALLHRAKKNKMKTVGMTRSWDNTTTKVYLRVVPDKIVVQNQVIKDELVKLHDINSEIIGLCGVPQFEEYIDFKPTPRDIFCAELGLDPQKKIILVSPASAIFIDTDWQILSILQEMKNTKRIPNDVQFLVRPHPYNDTDYNKFVPDKNFVFEKNLTIYKGARSREREEGRKNRLHLADTLAHVDVVINTVSSLVVDAVIFDKPVITIGFDGREKKVPFLRSVKRWHIEECVVYFLSHGATPVVQTEDELAQWINTYLAHPEVHKDERKRFAGIHTWQFDGKSAERIVKLVTE